MRKRLHGIPLSNSNEAYKLIAYVNDMNASISCLEEFQIVDKGSSLFKAASGCHLHRNPSSGKVLFWLAFN